MNGLNYVTAKSKKCIKCTEIKEAKSFHINTAQKDGLQSYCKKCVSEGSLESRGLTNELSEQEESILLRYLPFSHKRSSFLCRLPSGETAEDSQPLTITNIARENGLTHGGAQQILYKFVRLRLASLLIKSDDEGVTVTNIIYKVDNIRDYIINKESTS